MNKKKGKIDFEEGLDKMQVLLEAKQLLSQNTVSSKKLTGVLTRCIYILMQGEKLTEDGATDLFFQITKTFQYKDKDCTLRRLTHIAIKVLSKQARDVYFATSSLTSEVNSSKDDPAIRASALRALYQITDASSLSGIERYLKQAVVDKHPVVASAAIVSSLHILSINPDGVKRWTHEIKGALSSDSPMVQYHALGLSYNLRRNDRKAISRLINDTIDQSLKSPLAVCLMIKIITKYIVDEGEMNFKYRDYIKNNLNHRYEMVGFEAANALASLRHTFKDSRDCRVAVAHLRSFLGSSKASLRFAAVRALNKLAVIAPDDVRECNLDLENLISQSDSNRSIAILAITTLLKTGTECTVEKFLKQIGEFLSEIDDGFKAIVVGSIRQLCQKYPSKHQVMMSFLSKMLREEGGYEYKKAIVDTIKKMIEDNEETKEEGLIHLCDFIEDCEHTSLAVEVLNLLGKEGPKTRKPSMYTRFIGNRLFLEASPVESAAATALAKFGVDPQLRDSIIVALDRSSLYKDDDVRDRDVFYKNILSAQDPILNSKFITDPHQPVSIADLESKLTKYLEGDCAVPFSMDSVDAKSTLVVDVAPKVEEEDDDSVENHVQQATELFKELNIGKLIRSAGPIHMTDSVSEFVIDCSVHIFKDFIVLQFEILNTVEGLTLENVSIEMDEPDRLRIAGSTTCPTLAYDQKASVFTCLELISAESRNERAYFTGVSMKYLYKDLESIEAIEDSFPLEDFHFVVADLIED